MASNVSDIWVVFNPPATSLASYEIAITSTNTFGVYMIPARCQVKQLGFIITTAFGTQTTDAVLKLQQLNGTNFGTTTTLVTWTLGPTDTKLSFPTVDLTAVHAGGPGTVVTGPGLGGNRTLATLATLIAGVVMLAPDGSLPTAVLAPGDQLKASITTAASGGSALGKGVCFCRLEVAPENTELTNVAISGQTANT